MTLEDAAKNGIQRLHSPQHVGCCYVRLDIRDDNTLGPWLRLFSPGCTIRELEYENPVLRMMDLGVASDSWVEFRGIRSAFDLDDMPNYIPLPTNK